MLRPLTLLAALAVSTTSLWAQANSDYFAYPSIYDDHHKFMRDTRQLTFNRMPGLGTDYKMGAGDVIKAEVVDVPSLDHRATIDNRGMVRFPKIGDLHVEGMTALELEKVLVDKLVEAKLLKEPQVLVHILEYVAKPYYMIGEIDRPGEYTMSQTVTLMDALLISGGIDSTAGGWGYLHRRTGEGGVGEPNPEVLLRNPEKPLPGTKVISFDLEDLKVGGVLKENPVLQRGDVVVIPRKRSNLFYVVGDVTSPGSYEIEEGSQLSVGQAIAQAGGPLKTAKQNKGVLIRESEDGTKVNIPIDFKGVLLGKADDLPIRRNDVLFIPGSASKTIGYGFLGAIPGTAARGVNGQTRRVTGSVGN